MCKLISPEQRHRLEEANTGLQNLKQAGIIVDGNVTIRIDENNDTIIEHNITLPLTKPIKIFVKLDKSF